VHAMTSATVLPHDVWNRNERAESQTQRLDRNWAGLLQELRVVLTGVQLLTGFLLTLPFQQRFTVLNGEMRLLYLATVTCSIAATVLLTTPVALHRFVFRRHMLRGLVTVSHRVTIVGLLLLGVAISGVASLVFSATAGMTTGVAAGIGTATVWVTLWIALPLILRQGTRADVLDASGCSRPTSVRSPFVSTYQGGGGIRLDTDGQTPSVAEYVYQPPYEAVRQARHQAGRSG
jgi:uncharacterized protein DUF6328